MRLRGWNAEEALAFVASKREIALTAGIEQLLWFPFLMPVAR
jgi:protein-tyrosine phosphatase